MCLRTFKCTTLSFVDAILIIIMAFELQMWMNVLEVLIFVMKMQFATILKEVILAFATVDTLAMDFFVLVSSIYQPYQIQLTQLNIHCSHNYPDVDECLSDNGGCDHNCTDSDGSYTCSCNNGYQLNSDGHKCDGKQAFVIATTMRWL